MADDPFILFDQWFAEARSSEPNDPEAMALATAEADGSPAVRMVLLKSFGRDGFTFFTNLDSRKGREIAGNPGVALLFHWKSLRRQVRIEGIAAEVPSEVADAYFASRSRESQLGAWASDQSRPLADPTTFERRYEEARRRFEGGDIPRPERWSGFCVTPRQFEFWTDRPHRLHERRLFTRGDGGGWDQGLLYP